MGKSTTTTLKLILAVLVLLTAAFGQEPKQPLVRQVSSTGGSTPTMVNGAAQQAAPVIEPKALPALNPPLGDIARQGRMAHVDAQKAEMVVESDALNQKADNAEQKTDGTDPKAEPKTAEKTESNTDRK